MQWITETIQDFESATEQILGYISKRYANYQADSACVVCLQGDLGAGKTTMTQMIAKQLGVVESLQSPTFVIKKTYQTNNDQIKKLVHIDAYRLEGEDSLDMLRLHDDFASPNTLMIIEWPEMISSIIPKNSVHIKIEHNNSGRKIQINK